MSEREFLSQERCGCPEGNQAFLTRRAVLGAAGAVGAGGIVTKLFGSGTSTQYAYAGAGYTGDTVVVLSLRGGFDGLSAVVPLGDAAYAKSRPTIAVPAAKALKLDAMFGLHPALSPLKALWDRGMLAAVHAVGQTNPSRSHFAAMEDMENAAPGSSLRTGWLDRMIGLTAPGPYSAVAAGSTTTPSSLVGPSPKIAVKSVSTFSLAGASSDAETARWTKALNGLYADADTALKAPAVATLGALSTVGKLKAAGYTPANGAKYPDTDFGKALTDLANMIKSGIGVRAATVDVGDWDMHVGVGKVDDGWMFRKLVELGQAISAFVTDLGTKMSDVTLVTLSEFGRRVAENASGGLDHGHGNACFIIGGGVVGGKVYGTWPGLAPANLIDGDLKGTTDYRTILAEVLEKRAKLSSADVFPQLDSRRLGLLRARA